MLTTMGWIKVGVKEVAQELGLSVVDASSLMESGKIEGAHRDVFGDWKASISSVIKYKEEAK